MTIEARADSWICSWDTGISSQTIWEVLRGQTVRHRSHNWPCDPSDFGRCVRLLAEIPEWRERLPEVAARFPGTPWVTLIERWDDVMELYEKQIRAEAENNSLPKRKRKALTYPCYELMKELGC